MDELIIELKDLDLSELLLTKKLYHGTSIIDDTCDYHMVRNINLEKSNKRLDFGPGYYLTPDYEQAKARALGSVKKHRSAGTVDAPVNNVLEELVGQKNLNRVPNKAKSIVIEYPFNVSQKEDLMNYKHFPLPSKEWVEFIFANRQNLPDVTLYEHNLDMKYDFVYGYMADGKFIGIVNQMFKKDIKTLSNDQFKRLYKTFLERKKRTGVQISLHSIKIVRSCLKDGTIENVEG